MQKKMLFSIICAYCFDIAGMLSKLEQVLSKNYNSFKLLNKCVASSINHNDSLYDKNAIDGIYNLSHQNVNIENAQNALLLHLYQKHNGNEKKMAEATAYLQKIYHPDAFGKPNQLSPVVNVVRNLIRSGEYKKILNNLKMQQEGSTENSPEEFYTKYREYRKYQEAQKEYRRAERKRKREEFLKWWQEEEREMYNKSEKERIKKDLQNLKDNNPYVNKIHDIRLTIDQKSINVNSFDELYSALLEYFTDRNKAISYDIEEEARIHNMLKVQDLLDVLLNRGQYDYYTDYLKWAFDRKNLPKNINFTCYVQNQPRKVFFGLFDAKPDYSITIQTIQNNFGHYGFTSSRRNRVK